VELRQWQDSGEESDELRALGGDFIATLQRNRWCRGAARELVLSERELRVLYKKRWNDVAGLAKPPFTLTLDENRVRFAFLINYPFLLHRRAELSRADPGGEALIVTAARLRAIERLAALDESYPGDLAQGVVRYQTGRYGMAAAHFQRHLEKHGEGPYTLRVQNYLKASLDQASDVSP